MSSSATTSASAASSSDDRLDFPQEELRILKYWDEIDAFHTSLKLSEGKPLYTFLDGPPFATGLPHYGHILAGTIKDTVLRYASLNGLHVERKFGWDCHGLPVEYEIDKKFGITSREDVLNFGGIARYNAECRAIVMRYSAQWEETVRRVGRWIDFKNDFKTMYPWFMESVWWVFKQLFERDQIYRGFRVMPYSTACTTPLSNFEVKQNYKDTTDPSVVVAFPLLGKSGVLPEGTGLLVWTTTPWTLPSNLAIAVKPDMEYSRVSWKEKQYVVASSRVSHVFVKEDFKVEQVFPGKQLVGLAYEAPFDFFADRKKQYTRTHTIVGSEHVTDDAGTGLVHMAPGFGEDDFNVCLLSGVITETDCPCPIDAKGCYVDPISGELLGRYVKDADPLVIKMLGERLFSRAQYTHSYPFCWRSDTPLIYRTVPCWFVRVTSKIPDILKASAQSRWVPEFVQEKRFHNWISEAHDWAISRNRYWGTPLPLWVSEDFEEIVCVGSIEELEALTGQQNITDLHREFIDHLTIPSRKGKGLLRRVEEVLDCWFESGAVPYAQVHYPFENREQFEKNFPADFIGEGLDQTRGWFYTLMVLGAHLFGQSPFKNLIVNGLVLAADGKKMSKRLKNYPEPALMLDKYGADALRLYLINSPVVAAETLRFKEEGVWAIVKDVLLPWYHSFRFLATNIDVYEKENGPFRCDPSMPSQRPANATDAWILAAYQSLVRSVRSEMDQYHLYTVIPPLLSFIESLTNWYIRFNRRRLRGEQGPEEMLQALHVLFRVLISFSSAMAPFAPFFAENVYQRLCPFVSRSTKDSVPDDRSVHFLPFPVFKAELFNDDIERAFGRMRVLVERARMMRESKGISMKVPLKNITVVSSSTQLLDDLQSLEGYILSELNVRELKLSTDEAAFGITYRAVPNFKELGQRLRGDFGAVQAALKKLTTDQLKTFMHEGRLVVLNHELGKDDLEVVRELSASPNAFCERDFAILLDTTVDESLKEEGLARDLVNRVQRLRKKANLRPTDNVSVMLTANDTSMKSLLERQMDFICKSIKDAQLVDGFAAKRNCLVIEEEQAFEDVGKLTVSLHRSS